MGEDGTVYVRARDGSEREVGQWPGGDPTEALELYVRRYDGLAVEVELLSRRIRQQALSPDEAQAAVHHVRGQLSGARVVGDVALLGERLDSLGPVLDEQRAQRRAARAARSEHARSTQERIVEQAEAVASAQDWRSGADRMDALMDQWQAEARVSRGGDDALWHRFSAARTAYTRRRGRHFAELHERRAQARVVKEKLAAEAESLAGSTEWGATAGRFRDLMRQWKAAGAAPRKDDEALWQRFRGAQDRFFGARDALNARTDAELAANAEVKLAILADAERLLPVGPDVDAARTAFRTLSERWDGVGKVPRERVRELEGRMQAVERALRSAEDDRWERDNPEARARAQTTVHQLESLLAGLRKAADAADAAGDERRASEARQSIAAREAWLEQARRALADFTP